MTGLSFSEPMVIAWNEGRKDVTRRIVKLPPDFLPTYACSAKMEDPPVWFDFVDDDGKLRRLKPRYRPGQTVYIKEAWMAATPDGGESFGILYRATLSKPWTDVQWQQSFKPDNRAEKYFNGKEAWRSPRFMPEWASRSKARIVSVRPERIRAITEEEARREGVIDGGCLNCGKSEPCGCSNPSPDARDAFAWLWEQLHPGSWERNDWVWRIELEKVTG